MFLRLEVSFDLFTYINRLYDGINLSTEIAELVPYRICRFWSLNGNTILMGASCSSDTCCFEHTFSVTLISIKFLMVFDMWVSG